MRIKKASVVIRFELSLGKLNSSNKLFPAQLWAANGRNNVIICKIICVLVIPFLGDCSVQYKEK